MNWYFAVLGNFADFGGRARRSEYWYFVLIGSLISGGLIVLDLALDLDVLSWLYAFAVLIPSLAVTVRRLHDTGRSGWWLLISLVPLIGLVLIFFMVQDSQPGPNRYGPSPKYDDLAPASGMGALP